EGRAAQERDGPPHHGRDQSFSKNLLSDHTSRARSPSNCTPTPALVLQRTWAPTSIGFSRVVMRKRSRTPVPIGGRSVIDSCAPPSERLRISVSIVWPSIVTETASVTSWRVADRRL